jgi:hypothetical protein
VISAETHREVAEYLYHQADRHVGHRKRGEYAEEFRDLMHDYDMADDHDAWVQDHAERVRYLLKVLGISLGDRPLAGEELHGAAQDVLL